MLDEALRTLYVTSELPLDELEDENLKEETRLAIRNMVIELDYLIDRMRNEGTVWDWQERFVDLLEEREDQEDQWPGGRNVTCSACDGNYTVENEPNRCPYCNTPASIEDVEGKYENAEGDAD